MKNDEDEVLTKKKKKKKNVLARNYKQLTQQIILSDPFIHVRKKRGPSPSDSLVQWKVSHLLVGWWASSEANAVYKALEAETSHPGLS